MEKYINCIAHRTSEGNLLIGDDKTALFDCGMLFCAKATIEKVKKGLAGKPLDYIFATHTHYDHIGALPVFRAEFPETRFVTSDVGAAVLLKDTPRRVIRELSQTAAEDYSAVYDFSAVYTDDAFHADIIVKEGDKIQLGGLTAEVIETPGHTRDSLSFYIHEPELLILSETPGVLMTNGVVCPSYLTSLGGTIESIKKYRRYPCKYLSMPHRGILSPYEANGFFEKALSAAEACNDFIIGLYKSGLPEEAILNLFYQNYYTGAVSAIQPEPAFLLNARATITCSIREYNERLQPEKPKER